MNNLFELLGLTNNSQSQQRMPYATMLRESLMGNSPMQYSGELRPTNINLYNRPQVKNNGGISTVYSMGVESDGKHYVIPRISDAGHVLSPQDAIKLWQQTGNHLGVFDTRENAENYAQQLHLEQKRQYNL